MRTGRSDARGGPSDGPGRPDERLPSAEAARELVAATRSLLAALALPSDAFEEGDRWGFAASARDRVRAALEAIAGEFRAWAARHGQLAYEGWALDARGWPEVAARAMNEVAELFGFLDGGWRVEDERAEALSREYFGSLPERGLGPGDPLPDPPPVPAAPAIGEWERRRLDSAAGLVELELGPSARSSGPPPADAPRRMSPTDERNGWLYGLALRGLTYPRIAEALRSEVARHRGWVPLEPQGCRDAVKAYVAKFGAAAPAPRRTKKNQGETP